MQDQQHAAGRGLDRLLVFESVQEKIEAGAGVHVAAKIQMMVDSCFAEILGAVGEIVAAVDGPEVAESDDRPAGGTAADVGDEESAFTRLFFKGLVKERSIDQTNVPQIKPRAAGGGVVVRHHCDGRA